MKNFFSLGSLFLLAAAAVAAVATSSLFLVVSAFPGGAGRCVVGVPSPTGPHSSPLQSLSSGGYEVLIDGATYDTVTGIVTATAGQKFNVTISGGGSAYKGVLIMIADEPDTAVVDFDDTKLKLATGSGCPGTASVTHSDASAKETSTVTFMVADPVETTLELNVVMSVTNSFYTQLDLEVV